MGSHYNHKKFKRERKLVEKWWVAKTENERVTLVFNIIHTMNDTVAAEIIERHHKSTKPHPKGQSLKEIATAMHIPYTTVLRKYKKAIEHISIIAKAREKTHEMD